MTATQEPINRVTLPTLSRLPTAAKALSTATILVMGIAFLGAMGQVLIHDIIPTFSGETETVDHPGVNTPVSANPGDERTSASTIPRGDLFADLDPVPAKAKQESVKFYQDEQFVWLHIPGGGLFALIFAWVSVRAVWEMWVSSDEG
jgi:hypothetical protein